MFPYFCLAVAAVVANFSTLRAHPRLPGIAGVLALGLFAGVALYLLALDMHVAVAFAIAVVVLMTFIPLVAALLSYRNFKEKQKR